MMRGFADSLFHKTIQISLDPMQYVEKRIVAYKNPAKIHFATPYITSPYTGMLFNSYCLEKTPLRAMPTSKIEDFRGPRLRYLAL